MLTYNEYEYNVCLKITRIQLESSQLAKVVIVDLWLFCSEIYLIMSGFVVFRSFLTTILHYFFADGAVNGDLRGVILFSQFRNQIVTFPKSSLIRFVHVFCVCIRRV